MSTVTAEIDPAKSVSVTDVRVRFAETDLMGVVHHASYLVYFEVARVEWLRKRGITYADWTHGGAQIAVVEAALRYRVPSRFDDLLSIETTLTKLRHVSIDYAYRIVRGETLIAEGSTRLASIDQSGRPQRMPDAMRAALSSGERANGTAR